MKYELLTRIQTTGNSIIEQVLINRGIECSEIFHYLNPTLVDDLPPVLENIKSGAKMLLSHLQDKIYLQVDSDVDGLTSSAILMNYLYHRFPSCIDNIAYGLHSGKQHGIDTSQIPEGTKLIIAPDSSSNEYEIHKELSKKGIDVLILDHHEAERMSPYACVINNQLCDYPTKSLSGAGIVYKFCKYLDSIINDGQEISKQMLDLTAVGLIGDVMNMRDIETMYLTQQGLKDIRNPFLTGMIAKNSYSLGDTLSPIGIAFYVVPLMNAVMRVGTIEEKKILFESMLEWKAHELIPSTKRGCKGQQEERVEQALRICTNCKAHQTKAQDKAVEQIAGIIEDENLNEHQVLLVRVPEPDFDREIVGLIANKLMGQYQKPVILVCKNEDETWSGSLRACGIDNFRELAVESGLVLWAQGHSSAAGIAFEDKNYQLLLDYFDNRLQDFVFSTNYKVDYILTEESLSPSLIQEIDNFKYLWGQGVEEPLIAVEGLRVTKDMLTLMSRDRNPTLKIQLSNGIAIIKFKSSEEELQSLEADGYVTINLVARCSINKYYERVTPQLLVTEMEIINKKNFYF